MSTNEDAAAVNAYATWVVTAICGLTNYADGVLRQHGAAVERCAEWQRSLQAPQPRRLYRGLALTREQAQLAERQPYAAAASISYTENRDVARWFACPDSTISGAIVEHEGRENVNGYLAVCGALPLTDILFHYSWRRLWTPAGVLSIVDAAKHSVRMGLLPPTGAEQVAWALATQEEVIGRQTGAPLTLHPLCYDSLDVRELELRFGPHAHGVLK